MFFNTYKIGSKLDHYKKVFKFVFYIQLIKILHISI